MHKLDQDVLLGGRYRLARMVGSGGMGTVWEAEDENLGRPVAVKVLSESLAGGERAVRRFEREARAAARLSGPHVAAVYDFGRSEGRPYIVMELVRGETLADRLAREGRLPSQEAARIATQVAEALEEAHAAGVVHRDVKPGNVMLTSAGDVKVMDFGIAAAAWAQRITTSDLFLGTPSYVAPEQAKGEKSTAASDVYALGAVLYEMVAGRPPFVGESPVAVAVAHVREDPPPLGQLAGDVPPNIAAAAMAALAKDPADRPASAAAFASMLREPTLPLHAIDAPEETIPLAPVAPVPEETTPLSPVPRHRDRRRILIPALLIGAVLLLTLAIVMVLARDRSILQRAQREARTASRVAVPELTGMTKAHAQDALADAGLVLGDVQREPGVAGIVISSEPPAGDRVRRGTSVTLIIGKSTPSTEEPPKEDHGKHLGQKKEKDD
jgi:eukaryotic-like serine/threonine-protein kinase